MFSSGPGHCEEWRISPSAFAWYHKCRATFKATIVGGGRIISTDDEAKLPPDKHNPKSWIHRQHKIGM